MLRLAASLMALVVFATSGIIGEVAYLCSMGGQVRSACCCKKAQATIDDDCAKVVRAGDCCELRVTKADHQPARFEATTNQAQLAPFVATLPVVAQRVQLPTRSTHFPSWARGPPLWSGAPLFVWKCTYLI